MEDSQSCCDGKPVIVLPRGGRLCKSHFISYFEEKVFRTIDEYSLLEEEEHLGVAVSGGKDSLTVLSLLKRLADKNQNMNISAIAINEGIHGYRDDTLVTAKSFCDKIGVPLHIYSYEQEFGMSLDETLKSIFF